MECEYCKADMECEAVKVQFGYGSLFDGDDLIFCTDSCLYVWLKDNLFPTSSINKESCEVKQ